VKPLSGLLIQVNNPGCNLSLQCGIDHLVLVCDFAGYAVGFSLMTGFRRKGPRRGVVNYKGEIWQAKMAVVFIGHEYTVGPFYLHVENLMPSYSRQATLRQTYRSASPPSNRLRSVHKRPMLPLDLDDLADFVNTIGR